MVDTTVINELKESIEEDDDDKWSCDDCKPCECGGEYDICDLCATPKCSYCGLCDCE